MPPPPSPLRATLRDALRVPGLVSLSRVLLAAACPLVVTRKPALALGIVALAGASDVLDGWLARRRHETTATGAALDAIADKIFVTSLLASMVAADRLDVGDALLLSTREIGEAPLAAWLLAHHDTGERRANALGKATTTLQFGAMLLALVRAPVRPLAIAAGLAGVAAAISYGRRERRAVA